ncbi:MAG: efflux RND transporter periplasmic adaptor subunit [Bacteroidota bacterium]|nr:efflux RND transporter periplasmic adaptor subunit [Odoribacter sp.]MDP3180593.1 efflux RND transporter periplasmic adaptor subunit [Bacteroidota bacterium]MDP3642637.1 efflux RND transporter periplasmic adaptor subunit [Bacteroidota bacterium]
MKSKIFLGALLAIVFVSCQNKKEATLSQDAHDEAKFQYTAYSTDFEVFAEADAFVVGETANVLSHFSTLPDFKALESGSMTIRLKVSGKEVTQTLDKPTRKGIYSFDIKAEAAGTGTLKFEITNETDSFEVLVPEVTVFAKHHEAHKVSEKVVISRTNTTVFTKEQSWKVDFATDFPRNEPFGQIIKTTAQVQSSQGDEIIVSAKTNGIVMITGNAVLEGKDVSKGQILFFISGSELADNNISVRYSEAKNNLEKAKADYERATELAKDKIISAKDLLSAKNQYDNAKAIFDNLNTNFSASGQSVKSPMSGFVKQVLVKNGTYVEAGQPIVVVSQNKTLLLNAEVQQKYASMLGSITSANIRTLQDNQSYSLEQLKGKVLSFGKATNSDNYLIPVTLQIDNIGSFTAGGFVEVYLKTLTNTLALTVPTTSLLEDQGAFFVYVQVTPELFEKREVKIGATDGVRTEIRSGLNSNERVVTLGAILIKLAQATGTLDAHSGHVH